jgi:hypothetical protein
MGVAALAVAIVYRLAYRAFATLEVKALPVNPYAKAV